MSNKRNMSVCMYMICQQSQSVKPNLLWAKPTNDPFLSSIALVLPLHRSMSSSLRRDTTRFNSTNSVKVKWSGLLTSAHHPKKWYMYVRDTPLFYILPWERVCPYL